jgi:hypothetical protein
MIAKIVKLAAMIALAGHFCAVGAQNLAYTPPDRIGGYQFDGTNWSALVATGTTGAVPTPPAVGLYGLNAQNQWVPCGINPCMGGAASSVPFSGITTGTNNTATMTVGAGATLTFTGGIVNANQLNGATIPASAALLSSNAGSELLAANQANVLSALSGAVCPNGAAYGGIGIFCEQTFVTGTYQGAYSSGTTYPNCAVVTSGGNEYVQGSITPTTGSTPGSGGSYWELQPSLTTFTSGVLPQPLDCADNSALAWMRNTSNYAILTVPPGIYTTNGGVRIRTWNASTESVGLSVVGAGQYQTQINAGASFSYGVIYDQEVSGAAVAVYALNGFQAYTNNKGAPYALQLVGNAANRDLEHLRFRGDSASQAAIYASADGLTSSFQDHIYDVRNEVQTNVDFGGTLPVVTVSFSTGVPVFTIVSGGNIGNPTLHAILVGTQGGTSYNPCSSMGTFTFTTPGGVLSAITNSSTGCNTSGTGAVVFYGGNQQYAARLGNITDAVIVDFLAYGGYEASLRIDHSISSMFGVHTWANGQYGVECFALCILSDTDIDYSPSANFYVGNNGSLSALGGIYTGNQEVDSSLFRVDTGGVLFSARDIQGNLRQTAEYHTIATPGGLADNSAQANALGTYVKDVQNVTYFGSGAGSTIWTSQDALAVPSINGVTQTETVTGATPALSGSTAKSTVNVTANVTSWTIGSGLYDGQQKEIVWRENATGGWTVSGAPANVGGTSNPFPATTANTCSTFVLQWQSSTVGTPIWLQVSAGSVNIACP